MPIIDMTFENGVFYAKEVGQVEKSDAETWARALRGYAATSPTPIVAVIDANEVNFVSAAARMIFAEASKTPKLKAICVGARDMMTMQMARVIGLLGERGRTFVFISMDEARKSAFEHLRANV
jgi:hypothetical protein